MAFFHPGIEIVFLLVVAGLWAMILYQLLFAFLGVLFRHRVQAGVEETLDENALPPVSILVPAHNEALVIEQTIQSLLALDYPKEKLEILAIDDGSTDDTAGIVRRVARSNERVRLYCVPPEHAAQGKANALNFGLKEVRHGLLAIYDADNTPESGSLRLLVSALLRDKKAVAAFGKFRTRNRHVNLLTRFINLETLSFQFMIQAGRYLLFKLAILPGTNFVIYKDAVLECGGWDPRALTEDTELSVRLYDRGHQIRFVPDAVTWEEEPQRWGDWVRQRTRWVRGNFYVLRKFLIPSIRHGRLGLSAELLHLFLLYYFFLGSILASHVLFVASGLGLIAVLSPGPYTLVWACAFVLFIAELMMVCSYEREPFWRSLWVAALMYITYCQAWLIVVFRAIAQEHFTRRKVGWEKTRRFASTVSTDADRSAE
jgi:cellulose synthase/poly-beta-1,6-N-acetylglucosamine synthase-like glycosyltransferase